jgi:peptide deformylase
LAILPIRQFGDQALRQECRLVESINKDIKNMIRNLSDTMYEARGLGLSANQVGILLRVLVMDDSGHGENLNAFANPEIIKSSGKEEDDEGCLSLGDVRVRVIRATAVTVRAIDLKSGEEVIIDAEDLTARIFQHEIDHLNGKLIIDRTSDKERKQALKQLSMNDITRI